ncbi:Tripartite-type tricarboxylate transporter, receptor component TctC [Variovorax sp. OK605]|jgi:tripartite-type tricarboxylate transporter receptor subunit TctC|uniref:Bug family tripartite tricarboxylate transporter substrate binding protein n=1 Tax=unclassified Variovorax TaxID=663243 RepID=UPI0008D23CCA|nr:MULTISPECIES: tripartite tricarboxylate transporter substrate binding protein [unclassified Variovorax]SEK15823.1 Tripartite-type tricarboxylate transporter, receptor component TctC [Variovorax sp. OK202]SFE21996.1 Tripartite-type tricarboxylate transporter, receptor component TctC [Variovorax sp. OK212]SFP89071.1 Tripartite-type tricarboxylate transporter, receptor component TctC [Variovorax sp. OK605]
MTPGITRRQACLAATLGAGGAFGLTTANLAFAQAYPARPVHIIAPFTPGGSTDLLARAIGQELGRAFSQAVVVDNVPGAGGSVGADKASKSPADGYTLLMGHIGTLAINPSLYPKLDYHPLRSFTPVAWVARVPNVLVVHASVPARTLPELIALAKARPGQMAFGSGGNGSAAHITMEYLKLQTGTSFLHIPYRGTAPAVNDLLAGQLQVLFTGAPALMPHIKAGKLRAIAVSSPHRIALLPDVPTVAESGVAGTKGFEADQWYGLVAPAGTPAAVVAALNQQINRSLDSAEVKMRLGAEGAEPTPTSPKAFGDLIASEMVRWDRVIKTAHVTVD